MRAYGGQVYALFHVIRSGNQAPLMLTVVEFESDAFPAVAAEDVATNPGRAGQALAVFLQRELPSLGVQTGQLVAEDWGWVVPVRGRPFRMWIGCGNEDGQANRFVCFIEPHTPTVWRWFRRVDTREHVAALREAIDQALARVPQVNGKRWQAAKSSSGHRAR